MMQITESNPKGGVRWAWTIKGDGSVGHFALPLNIKWGSYDYDRLTGWEITLFNLSVYCTWPRKGNRL